MVISFYGDFKFVPEIFSLVLVFSITKLIKWLVVLWFGCVKSYDRKYWDKSRNS